MTKMTKTKQTAAEIAAQHGFMLIAHDGEFTATYRPNKRTDLTIMRGDNANLLAADMVTAIEMKRSYRSFSWVLDKETDEYEVFVKGTTIAARADYLTAAFRDAKAHWAEYRANLDEDTEEGDEQDDEESTETGSVVASRYRAIYAERGDPTSCGDWLSAWLKERTTNKAGINVEVLDQLATLNGVDLAKYRRDTAGWQGRLRMTFRNILARKVWEQGFVVDLLDNAVNAPRDWISAQRFAAPKKKEA